MKKSWYQKKWITVLVHSLAWILLFSLPYLLRPSYNPEQDKHPQPTSTTAFFWVSRLSDLLLISFFYLNALQLVPRFFYKRKIFFYVLLVLVSFACYVSITWLMTSNFVFTDSNYTLRKHIFFRNICFSFYSCM